MDCITICVITMIAILSVQLCHKLVPRVGTKITTIIPLLLKSQFRAKVTSNKQNNGTVPRIYTRTGDNGTSALFTNERRSKNDHIFNALGTTDELSSSIGFASEFVSIADIREELEQIQCILQDLQSALATPRSSAKESQLAKTKWNINNLVELELWIDNHSVNLPPLKNFILPSGGKASAALHMSRAICRRAERTVVPLLDDGLELPILQYLNRLSSYLFTVARVCAVNDGHEEKIYRRLKPIDT